jgi:class 3 adenylate cyclase
MMGIALNRKLATFAALSALAGTAVVAGLAYWSADRALSEHLRDQASSASHLLATRVGDELKHLADRARFYISTSQRREFEADGEILAVSVLKRPSGDPAEALLGFEVTTPAADWQPALRWTLPPQHASYLSSGAVTAMDYRYPVDTDRIKRGQSDALLGRARSQSVLRIAVPYGEWTPQGYTQALVIDAKPAKLHAIFAHRDGLVAFMTAARGQLVIASDPRRFETAEDLTKLTAFNEASESRSTHGAIEYRETPQGGLQHAAYAKVSTPSWATSGLTVFVQAPHSRASVALRPLALAMASAALVFALLLGYCVGWIGPRLVWAFALSPDAKKPPAPPIEPSVSEPKAEAKEAAAQAVAIKEAAQAAVAATVAAVPFAKIADPEVRQAFAQGQHKTSGERVQAAVLHCHLYGVDHLSAHADPEKFLNLLNEFNQKAVRAIEAQQGMVDHIHGGSIVAFWGVPKSHSADVSRALHAARAIREAANALTEALEDQDQEPSRLSMGLHYGALTVGQVGTQGRLEYSAVGEGLEVAARICQFADPLGTDLLVTAPAVKRAGKEFELEEVTAGDESNPALFELAQDESDEDAGNESDGDGDGDPSPDSADPGAESDSEPHEPAVSAA